MLQIYGASESFFRTFAKNEKSFGRADELGIGSCNPMCPYHPAIFTRRTFGLSLG